MEPPPTEFGPEAMAAAVEADLVAHVARMHEPPIGEVHREHGAVWFVTGLPSEDDNGILRAELPDDRTDEAVDRLLEPFRARSLPLMWWFFTPPSGLAPGLGRVLDAAGLTRASDRPGMGLDLTRFAAPSPPPGASLHRVRDEEMFDAWIDVVGRAFDAPDFADGPSASANRALGFGDDAPFRHFLCRVQDTWVAASTLSLGAGVAGLGNISTVPGWRGRGLGTAVAAAALTEGKGMGLRIGALSADEPGVPLYRRLGFETVCRHLTYVWRPAAR
jgi:GNAT superfamily N-acetyltransferase